ncbi:ion channel [Hydrogenovibrio sp. 3SP14C1]|uniref:ion channel n=1 Tax=Hydrogenovibrio sp. 3SP14C1 TaxID=3038774 RepID=UPI00241710AD|nr:ion channel [Hydrogenovibrio sp. 3SP14C1]MDG4813342.1 ion channel [Hydrogenovibrio sp. 3SP14C1]
MSFNLRRSNIKALLGVEGVSPNENARAVKVGAYLSYAVFLALLVVVIQLVLDYSDTLQDSFWISVLVWGVFTTELVVNLWLVDDRKRYIQHNWLNVLIIILVFPWFDYGNDWAAILRGLRLVLFLRVVLDVFADVVNLLKQNSFGLVLSGAFFFIILAGAIFSVIEEVDFTDGVWYALVTITTVGYGDIVPLTGEGRLFGAALIIIGVILFSLVMANISAFLIGSEQKEREKDILNHIKKMQDHLDVQAELNEKRLSEVLSEMSTKVDGLEKRMQSFHAERFDNSLGYLDKRVRLEKEEILQKMRQENEALLSELRRTISKVSDNKKT